MWSLAVAVAAFDVAGSRRLILLRSFVSSYESLESNMKRGRQAGKERMRTSESGRAGRVWFCVG